MEVYDTKAAELIERSYQTPEIVNQRLQTLNRLALKNGESVLDAGCGTGLLLQQLALAVGGTGRADGVDYSNDMLAFARRRCAGLDQVGLSQGSIETLTFDAASFDALSCTQTLLYVNNIEQALAEFYRVLRPAGRIAIVETDWSGAIINSPDPELTKRILGAWDRAVVNPNLPRRLEPLLRDKGFLSIRVEAIPILNAGYTENSFSANLLRSFAATAGKQKTVTEQEANDWLIGIDELKERGHYFFCVNRFLFTAVK